MNHELPDVQTGFRKGRGTRNQIANIHWIIKKTKRTFHTKMGTIKDRNGMDLVETEDINKK